MTYNLVQRVVLFMFHHLKILNYNLVVMTMYY